MIDLQQINNGGRVASLKEKKKKMSNSIARPGSGWEDELPSTKQQVINDADEKKLNARRANLKKQMNMAIERRIHKNKSKRGHGKRSRTKRPQTPSLRREISFPGLPMDDGRPPWRSMVTAHIKRPKSAAIVKSDRRKARNQSISKIGKDLPDSSVPPPLLLETPRTPRSALDHKRKIEKDKRMLKMKKKAEKLKASLPSYYHPIEQYHPEIKEYIPRRKSYTHEYVVMSETPGAGKYKQAQFGSGIRGGVISESKGKSSIEWVQYYAQQIPAPGQYYPVDPNLDPNCQPCVRIPAFVGKTYLERIILNAKTTPGPGAYSIKSPIKKGGVISKAKSKSDVDWAVYRASTIPGPQDYPAPPLPKQGGGRFSNAVVPTEVEVLMRRTEQLPGPSDYSVNKMDSLPKGGKLNQNQNDISWLDRIAMVASETPGSQDYKPLRFQAPGGGRFSTAKPKDHVEMLICKFVRMIFLIIINSSNVILTFCFI
jgi:hypothetical protein